MVIPWDRRLTGSQYCFGCSGEKLSASTRNQKTRNYQSVIFKGWQGGGGGLRNVIFIFMLLRYKEETNTDYF